MSYKTSLRSEVLSRRDGMLPDLRAQKSSVICQKLLDEIKGRLTAASFLKIAVFESMRTEVDLGPFIAAAQSLSWNLCFPCVVRDGSSESDSVKYMAFFHVPPQQYEHAREAFLTHPMRVHSREKLAGEGFAEVGPAELDVVIVPLVAFDDACNRLGYGGGNYDQLLPRLRENTLVLGVAFEEQRVVSVPCEPHDQRLPLVVWA